LQETLNKVLVFNKMERHLQRKVVSEMYERTVSAGEILIKEGDTGLAAAELYVVKTGKFEVRQAALSQQQPGQRGAVLCHACSSMGVFAN
jgi:cGMP-dependent protein kinase 2